MINKAATSGGVFFVALLAVLTILLSVACSRNAKSTVAKVSIELADRLNPEVATPPKEVSSTKQRVYVDSSLSMQGFVGKATLGRTKFDEFLDAMPDAMPGCEVFRYGQASRQEGQ